MRKTVLFIVLLILSCKSQKHNSEVDDRLVLLIQDGYFPVERPETLIIKDAKSLRAFFSRVNQTRKPGLPVPEIDFSTYTILVACLGAVNTDALPVMYLKRETAEEIVISTQIPSQNRNLSVQTYPFCMYTIPNEGKRITMVID